MSSDRARRACSSKLRLGVGSWTAALFDVAPDGRRFVIPEAADLTKAKVVLVQNWFEELARMAPTTPD